MKLSNFLRYDPNYQGVGLPGGNRLEAEIWKEFAHDASRLRLIAETIRDIALEEVLDTSIFDSDATEEATEGALLTKIHRFRERDPAIVRTKKIRIICERGCLRCEACSFDFEAIYGELGRGYAECHHTQALSELRASEKVRLCDLSIVCANCHRMIHRRRPWLSIEALRELLRDHRA